MKFQVKDKRVILIDRTMRLVGDNEYEFIFEFDEEWEGKVKTARFVMGDYMKDIVLNDDKCLIEKTFFNGGQLIVGVYSSNVATEVLKHQVKPSILEEDGAEPTVPEDLWTQLLEIVETDVQYVRNAVSDAEQHAQNAQEAVSGFGDVVQMKTAEFNTNAANKQTAYDENADTKIREYDEHIIDYTAEINSLKDDIVTKANQTDLDRTNLYVDALFKLNRGQTWDTIESENNPYSVDVPNGVHYAGIDKVGGKSLVWNQCWGKIVHKEAGVTYTKENGIYHVVKSTTANNGLMSPYKIEPNHHKYYVSFSGKSENEDVELCVSLGTSLSMTLTNTMQRKSTFIYAPSSGSTRSYIYYYSPSRVECEFYCTDPIVIDLTQMFGAGNEPSTVEEFEAMFPADYYPYSDPTIISSQTDRVDVATADSTVTQQITTGFPVLNSAGSVYDYIDLNERKLHQRVTVVDLGTLKWRLREKENHWVAPLEFTNILPKFSSNAVAINGLSNKYIIDTAARVYNRVNPMSLGCEDGSKFTCFNGSDTEKPSGLLYYELAGEIVTDITIPTELTDWLTVEAGGSITFHNTDEGKRLLIPNKLSFVRKLDEVTV